jgi:hypothetical protein
MPSWAIYGNERRRGISGTVGVADNYTQFLSRIAAQDATHENAYIALINGLTEDGVWSKIQCLYIFAAAQSATALTNIKTSASFDPATALNTPTFTADVGYNGLNTTDQVVDSGYNNSTNGSLDNQHLMAWNGSNTTNSTPIAGAAIVATDNQSNIYPKFTADNKHYGRINNDTGSAGVAVADPTGMLLVTRLSSTEHELYFNGVDVGVANDASAAAPNLNIYFCGQNQDGTAVSSSWICRAGGIGTGLTATEAADYYTHLAAYMAAIDA